jgi:hypothetical protein
MHGYSRHRARAGTILIPAACVGLAVVAGCGAASTASTSLAQPTAASSAAAPVTSPPLQVATAPSATSAAVPTAASPSGDSSSGESAVVNMQDSQGDSFTQSVTFGSLEAESDVPDAVSGVQSCQLGVAIPARNLVVPVQITTTLNSSIQTQLPIQMNIGQFSSELNEGLPVDFIYQTTGGDLCSTGGQPGADVTLSQGQSTTTQAWIVLQDAVTPAYPDGNPAQLGANFIYFNAGAVTSAQGTAVCTGDAQTQQMDSPPFLRFAGNAPAGEDCSGKYTAPPA